MRFRYSLFALTASGILASAWPGTVAAQTAPAAPPEETLSPLARIEKTLEARRQALHVPGVAFAIVKDDKVIYSHGFGVRDVAGNLPVTPETLFAIGSSTKAFTAMTMLMSADDGKLKLTDSPKRYLSYFRLQDADADAHITLSDILSHRSGLARTDMLWAGGALKPEQLIRALGDVKPTAKLGEKFQYQNLMFLTAGEIVGKVQRAPWTKVVRQRIFKPLGMTQTDTAIETMQRATDFALGYTWDAAKSAYTHLPMRNLAVIAPAGAINSNVTDMARWVQFMLNGGVWNGKRLISEQNFAELTVPRITVAGEMKYGYGWFLRDWNGHKVVEHGGNIDGFNAEVALMPDQHLGFVMLTNVSASSLGETAQTAVWENLVGKPAPGVTGSAPAGATTAPQKMVSATGPMQDLIGPYTTPKAPITFEIAARGGNLVFVVPGQPAYPLAEKAKDVFALGPLPPDFALLVHRDGAGKVVGATLKQPAAQGDLELRFGADAPSGVLPPIEEVMQKRIAAVGGEAALRRHHSLILEMRTENPTQGLTGTTVIRAKAPSAQLIESTVTVQKKKIFGSRENFDGETGVEVSTLSQPTPRTEKEMAQAKIDADFYAIFNWKSLYKSAVVKRREKVGDEECYVVELTPAVGNPTTLFLSTQSYLLLKQNSSTDVPGIGLLPSSELFSDYRTVDGIKAPFRRVSSNPMTGETISTVTKIRFNVRLSDALFRNPAAPSL
jgi:CubicO group peptidase (beta-lactamase class C family)